jgi:hypothetical protein
LAFSERESKLIEPIVEKTPSTVMVLLCIIVGRYS